jgi:hypothetical protein
MLWGYHTTSLLTKTQDKADSTPHPSNTADNNAADNNADNNSADYIQTTTQTSMQTTTMQHRQWAMTQMIDDDVDNDTAT